MNSTIGFYEFCNNFCKLLLCFESPLVATKTSLQYTFVLMQIFWINYWRTSYYFGEYNDYKNVLWVWIIYLTYLSYFLSMILIYLILYLSLSISFLASLKLFSLSLTMNYSLTSLAFKKNFYFSQSATVCYWKIFLSMFFKIFR